LTGKTNGQDSVSELTKRRQAAIEAVAKWLKTSWEEISGTSNAWLLVEGKRVAVDTAILPGRGAGHNPAARPHLRFDKVANRLIARLRTACNETVPNGTAVLLAVTAPIQQPSKTIAALKDRIQNLVARESKTNDVQETIHGNGVRMRLLRNLPRHAPRLIGFVHNPESDPHLLFDLTGELLEIIGSGVKANESKNDRWLIAINPRAASFADAYRTIYAQLGASSNYKRAFMVFADGGVEELTL